VLKNSLWRLFRSSSALQRAVTARRMNAALAAGRNRAGENPIFSTLFSPR
jgi:hypothetical protein